MLVASTTYVFSEIPVEDIHSFRKSLLEHFHSEHGDIINELDSYLDLSDDLRHRIEDVTRDYKKEVYKTEETEPTEE